VEEAVSFLRTNAHRPFFLYLAHMYVHLPLYVEERFREASRNGAYGAAVASIDWATGVLLDELEALGLADDTIVIFTSDNGSLGDRPAPLGRPEPIGGSNLPLRGWKGTTFEGGLRVPAIVRWPGRVPAGDVYDGLVTSLDLFPSLAAVCGAAVPTDRVIDGIEASDVLFGVGDDSPRDTFAYYRMNDLEAVRDGRWKLFFSRFGEVRPELYDLLADPAESVNLVADEPDAVARLSSFADIIRADLGDERLGIAGAGVRPIGRVEKARPLTVFDPHHPYTVAEYDLPERG